MVVFIVGFHTNLCVGKYTKCLVLSAYYWWYPGIALTLGHFSAMMRYCLGDESSATRHNCDLVRNSIRFGRNDQEKQTLFGCFT